MPFQIKRVYEPYSKSDGFRVLVNRLWPRGISKKKAHINLWLKDIAPSDSLRKWYEHDEKKWKVFRRKYLLELKQKKTQIKMLVDLKKKHKTITLLYSSKSQLNNATVLCNLLKKI